MDENGTLTVSGVQSISRRTNKDEAYVPASTQVTLGGELKNNKGEYIKLNAAGGLAEGLGDDDLISFTMEMDDGTTRTFEIKAGASKRDLLVQMAQATQDGSSLDIGLYGSGWGTNLSGVKGVTFEAQNGAALNESALKSKTTEAKGVKDSLGGTVSATTTLTFKSGKLSDRVDGKKDGEGSPAETGAIRRKVWVTSYPVMIQSGVECFLWSFGAIVSGWFGKIQLASYQVVNTIAQLGFMTYMSFGIATSIRVANYTGLRDTAGMNRITSAGLHLNILLATIASLIFLIGGRHLIHAFTPDPEVIAVALTLIIPLILYQYGDAVQLTYANALRGTSDVKPLLWISIVSYIIVGIPLLLFLSKGLDWECVGVYYSFSGALIVASLLLRNAFNKAVTKKEKEFTRP